jgi:hypothetical protein
MATSNKAQDPAAAALSAIEEALNLTGSAAEEAVDPETSTPIFPKLSEPEPDETTTVAEPYSDLSVEDSQVRASGTEAERGGLRLPEIEDHPLFAPKKPERSKSGDFGKTADFAAERGSVTPSVPPANDDRDSVGALLRGLNRKPSGAPFVLAAIFSASWIGIAAIYFTAHRAEFFANGALAQRPELALYALAVFGPVIFFIVTALLARRAQEMRLTARSMVEIVMRLAEPESIATEQMVTLSQAIRREIVSMGDGIERALARAGELETLVRSEVSNLERSYSDNERRIRALVEELSSEREAMQANSERMRNAITGAQDSLSHELDLAFTGLAENLGAAGNRITSSLGAKTEEIRFELGHAGDQLIEGLTGQAEAILDRLERAKQSIDVTLQQANVDISQGFAQRLSDVDVHMRSTGEALTSNVVQRIDDAGARIATVLGETISALATQSDQVNERVSLSAQESLESFAFHAGTLNDRFAQTAGEAINAIATHSERVSETLGDRLGQFELAIIGQGNLIADRLGDDAQQLSMMLAKQFDAIEAVLAVQGGELDGKLELRARQTAEVFASQTQAFEDRASAKVQEMAESLDTLIMRIDSGLNGRAKSLNETLAARTIEIANVLGEGGREVARALESRADEINEILGDRVASITHSAADRTKLARRWMDVSPALKSGWSIGSLRFPRISTGAGAKSPTIWPRAPGKSMPP